MWWNQSLLTAKRENFFPYLKVVVPNGIYFIVSCLREVEPQCSKDKLRGKETNQKLGKGLGKKKNVVVNS